MGNSLQDQLKKAGLISKQKAKQAEAQKRKQDRMQRKQGIEVVDENKVAVQKANAAQIEKDRQLNLEQKQAAEHKAITAQVKQLIEINRQPKTAENQEGEAFNFTHSGAVKSIYVSTMIRQHISEGKLAVVALGDGYEVVAEKIAAKIKDRSPESIILLNDRDESAEDDDPYADFEIPDDLTW